MSYIHCKCCGSKIFEWDDAYFVEGLTVCRNCYEDSFFCEECGDRFFNEHNAGDVEHDLCQECLQAQYHSCTCCNSVVRWNDTVWYRDEPYCQECYEIEVAI